MRSQRVRHDWACTQWIYINLCVQAQLCPTLLSPWTVANQTPLSMGLFKQEHWSGLPFPPPGDLPNPGIKLPVSSTLVDEPPGKPMHPIYSIKPILFWKRRLSVLRNSFKYRNLDDQTWCQYCAGNTSYEHSFVWWQCPQKQLEGWAPRMDEWQILVYAHTFPQLVFVTLGKLLYLSQSQLLSYKMEIIIVLLE